MKKKKKTKRLSLREARRIATTKQRYGEDFFERNAREAGKQTPTKFDSERGRAAAQKRWDNYRTARINKLNNKGK